ncbi:unnamed protein product [Rodentolepis nana]|uniref:Uncharacterized protein n=1 Tax=Rodentolepis nana TaxID=102285 RepID=A0A0R3T2G9_RODNA|nr:unnamed protein product [Rodentolepis nana]
MNKPLFLLQLANENSPQADKSNTENTSNRAKSSSVDDRRLPLRGDTSASAEQTQVHQLQLDELSASGSKPSLFVHLHKHRRRHHRKIIRGRIFGFLADWSSKLI